MKTCLTIYFNEILLDAYIVTYLASGEAGWQCQLRARRLAEKMSLFPASPPTGL